MGVRQHHPGESRQQRIVMTVLVGFLVTVSGASPAATHQGGESWLDAWPIQQLPFEDSGTTVGYGWDGHWSWIHCPVLFEGADVFYSFTPDHNMFVDIDLCGSEGETRLGIRDSALNEVACTDDDVCQYYGPDHPCGLQVSRLARVPLSGGQLYYIMVGHWSSGGAAYTISVREDLPLTVACPPDGIDEGEPDIVPGRIDTYNSGCSGLMPGAPIQDLALDALGEFRLCGNSGWPFGSLPDTDWFAVSSPVAGALEITLESERTNYVMHLAPPDCESYQVQQWGLAGHGGSAQITVLVEANVPAWIFVAPRSCRSDFWPETGAFNYVLTIHGPTVTTTSATWGTMKSLFR